MTDAERFAWWFNEERKSFDDQADDYLIAQVDCDTLEKWRAYIDSKIEAESVKRSPPTEHPDRLKRIEQLMQLDPEKGTPEGDELLRLATEQEAEEKLLYPVFDRVSRTQK